MSDAFSVTGVGPDRNGWRDVTIPTGKASIEWYGVSITDLDGHGGPDAGFDVFHPNGVHVGYLRQVYPADTHGCYVPGLAEPQFVAISTTGDGSLQAAPIPELVEILCEIAGPSPAEDWDA
jgi:hypothetical protein